MDKYITISRRSFVIVEPDPVIGLDLTGILQSEFPEAELKLFRRQEDAEQHIHKVTSPICVVLSASVATAPMLALLQERVASQGEVLFIGSERDVGFPAAFVQTPFTSEMILSGLIRQVG
ncbi:hypothetical protein [uncultured Sulfitobacter sp.]|uniref:hypothetical protein n=1 Tax=uncultured Sulfitobacter sp. TaxID=191468 RepID=UPI002625F62E|nr:hypothetical protein [uncultured Sulfitobacter sp.]